jgi:hypothetical protein
VSGVVGIIPDIENRILIELICRHGNCGRKGSKSSVKADVEVSCAEGGSLQPKSLYE